MAGSTLDPDNMNLPDRQLGKGHGTSSLGPSDTSDSGSDVMGGPGFAQQLDLGLATGTTSDPEASTAGFTAGPDVGDANLDSDSDSFGTGEASSAARDTLRADGPDIDTDHIEYLNPEDAEEDIGDVNLQDTLADGPIADSPKDQQSPARR